jgi:formyl-CoA transferase
MMPRALDGVRVLDATQVMAGPFCAMQLCDMGADVIKVEPPGGDSSRRMAGAVGDDSAGFNAVNRGKRGLVLDLRTAAAQEAFRRLAARADVVIENSRPGVMRRFGLHYDALAADHPGLIYASISGYGQTGPAASKGGFDLVAQGVSGLMSITGEPDGPPVKVGVPVTDLGAGLFALAGILAALHYRARTGRGQYIDTALVDAGVALSVWESAEYFSGGGVPQPMGSAHRLIAPYQAIRCADGFINLAAANDRLFERLCLMFGHPEWATDARFVDNTSRVRHRAALAQVIESETVACSCAEVIGRLEAAEIPCGPINTYDQVFDDPQVKAREMVVATEHPTLGPIRTLGSPLKMSATPVTVGRPAPRLGEHSVEILREAGYADDQIAAIVRAAGNRTSTS